MAQEDILWFLCELKSFDGCGRHRSTQGPWRVIPTPILEPFPFLVNFLRELPTFPGKYF